MKINNPLDKILGNEVKIKILRFFIKTGAKWNGRQIAKEIGVTPATSHKALQGLYKEGVLSLENIGKTHLYNLNSENYVVSSLLEPLFDKEGKILNNIIAIIKKNIISAGLREHIVSIVLFGSVSLRKDTSKSDIDLAVIVRDQKSLRAVEALFEKVDHKISAEFGNVISAYINTTAEFKAKHKEGLDIVNNILKANTLIYGRQIEKI